MNDDCIITSLVPPLGETPPANIIIPDLDLHAFTPDGDVLNDGFFPNGFGISNEDYTFMIFDRWGEMIFESHRKFSPWNGTYRGKVVQNGVYVWKLFFTDINGKSHTKIGHVTIVK